MIDESLDVKEVIYSAERVSVLHGDEPVSIATLSTGYSGGNCSLVGESVRRWESAQLLRHNRGGLLFRLKGFGYFCMGACLQCECF